MKRTTYLRLFLGCFALWFCVFSSSLAQDSAVNNPQVQTFSQQQLDQLLAPIALYPDSLVSQILMASTYPLEIVEAARWASANKNLTGDALAKALEQQPWDPSVKSLVNFPQVLTMMNTKLDWTQQLGDAVLAQQQDVMATVQKLRQKANAQGTLKSTPQQKVTVDKSTKIVVIEPVNPNVFYVPVYNPMVVYGPWWYPAYPPYYYYPPGYNATAAVFSFAAGVAIGAAWGYAWGGCNWHNGDIDINVNRNVNVNNNYINRNNYINQHTWHHDPEHRRGVGYHDQATAHKFNQPFTHNAATHGKTEKGKEGLGTTQKMKPHEKTTGKTTGKTKHTQANKKSSTTSKAGMNKIKQHQKYQDRSRESHERPERAGRMEHSGGHERMGRR